VGTGEPGAALARRLDPARSTGVEVLGFLGDYVPVGTPVARGLRVLGSPRQAAEVARAVGAEELLVVTRAVSWETLDALVQEQAGGLEVRLVPDLSRLAMATVQLERIGSVTVLHPERRSISGADAGLKAALDRGIGLALLALAAPWLAWQRWRRGPWRRVEVVGRHGQPFRMVALPGQDMPIGTDRLPALLNVLRREMSLV